MYNNSGKISFHFKLDVELLTLIRTEAKSQALSVSKLINRIFTLSYFLIEKADFTLLKIDSDDFNENDLIMTKELKITIDRKYKYKLFNMQDHFHLRSKGALLRHIIRKYFEKIEKWYRQEKSPKRDVRRRCLKSWERLKNIKTITDFGNWTKKKIVHMDDFSNTISYVYDDYNCLCSIIHRKLPKNE